MHGDSRVRGATALPETFRTDAAQSGNDSTTTADPAKSTFPPADFRGGDSPVDHPGASCAQPAPTTVEVVQPERTIVRNVDDALPIVLSRRSAGNSRLRMPGGFSFSSL